MTEFMDLLKESGTAIGAAIGAVVALVGAFSAAFSAAARMSHLARVRRRINIASALSQEAHADLRPDFERLQREESGRYLALVQGRIGNGAGSIALLFGLAAVAYFFVLVGTLATGSGSWSPALEGAGVLVWPFGLVGIGATTWSLRIASTRHEGFLKAYRARLREGEHETFPEAPTSWIPTWGLLSVTSVSIFGFVAVGGFLLGRYLTTTGRAHLETDVAWLMPLLSAVLFLSLIIAAACLRFLFPELPPRAHTLRTESEAAPATQAPSAPSTVKDDPAPKGPPTPSDS